MPKWCFLVIICCFTYSLAFAFTVFDPKEPATIDSLSRKEFLEAQAHFQKTLARAEKGESGAKYDLAFYYIYGDGVAQDTTKGYQIVRQFAEEGDASDQDWWADICAFQLPQPDIERAISWWRKAAAQGHVGAYYSLGQCYEKGWGVPQDDYIAFYWYHLSALRDYYEVQDVLSYLYFTGKGVEQNYEEAYFWKLIDFPNYWNQGYSSIENIAYHLTESQRASVKARAKKWFNTHNKSYF